MYFVLKAILSGIIVALVSVIAKRWPGYGGLLASLPLISVLGMIWLWRDTRDPVRMAAHAEATFWFVLPSLPMFLLIPAMLRREVPFAAALAVGCLVTMVLYGLTIWIGPRFGLRLYERPSAFSAGDGEARKRLRRLEPGGTDPGVRCCR